MPNAKEKPGIIEIEFRENLLKGIAASPGVAMGKVCIHKDIFSHIPVLPIEDHQIGDEIRRVQKTVEDIEEAIRNDQEMIRRNIGPKEAEIFSVHLSIIEDSHYLAEIFERIATQKIKAEAAVLSQIRKYEEVFSKVGNPYLKDRILKECSRCRKGQRQKRFHLRGDGRESHLLPPVVRSGSPGIQRGPHSYPGN